MFHIVREGKFLRAERTESMAKTIASAMSAKNWDTYSVYRQTVDRSLGNGYLPHLHVASYVQGHEVTPSHRSISNVR